MKIAKQSRSEIAVILTRRERQGIRASILESWNALSESEILAQLGVDGEYLHSVITYLGEEISYGPNENLSQSPTLTLIRIKDEYHLIMSPQDVRLITQCLETALRRVAHWEFHLRTSVYPKEVEELLEEFRKLL
jgi:hypothetical protein